MKIRGLSVYSCTSELRCIVPVHVLRHLLAPDARQVYFTFGARSSLSRLSYRAWANSFVSMPLCQMNGSCLDGPGRPPKRTKSGPGSRYGSGYHRSPVFFILL